MTNMTASKSKMRLVLGIVYIFINFCDGGFFWHISDLHLDYEYVEGGNISNFCHQIVGDRSEAAPSKICDSDKTRNCESPEVKDFGNYNCDSPLLLVESALAAMSKVEPEVFKLLDLML